MDLESNINKVLERIGSAAERADRGPHDIRLVAVSKKVEPERILEAINCGIDTFGENYAQELRDKRNVILDNTDSQVHWHFIGRIQKNKVS